MHSKIEVVTPIPICYVAGVDTTHIFINVEKA